EVEHENKPRLVDERRSQHWPPLFRFEFSPHLRRQNYSFPSEDTPAVRDISFDRASQLRHWLFGIDDCPRNVVGPRNGNRSETGYVQLFQDFSCDSENGLVVGDSGL